MISNIKTTGICVALGLVAALTACREDDMVGRYNLDGRIAFQVTGTSTASTRSDGYVDPLTIALGEDEDSLSMMFYMQGNADQITPAANVTRGVDFDESYNPVTNFTVSAFAADGTVYFSNEQQSIDDSGLAITDYGWPNQSLTFMAYAATKNAEDICPVSISGDTENGKQENKWEFHYSLPESDGQNDAVNQQDIVFAVAADRKTTSQPVNLLFHHALSSILFKVGKMPSGTTLTGVALKGFYKGGTCQFSADTSEGIDNVVFDWTLDGYADGNYVQQFGGQRAVEGDRMGSDECLFIMMPQQLSEDAVIELTLNLGDREYTFTKKITEVVDQLLPDHKYIFTIGLPNEVDITVTDEVVDNTKFNLSIQNTGFSTAYVRAAVVGYWVDDEGVVQQPWDRLYDGEFVYGAEWANYWRLGDDGFYYYLVPLMSGEYTYPLFDTYTLTATGEIYYDLTLELSIVAQSVVESEYESAWTIPTASSENEGAF